MTVNSFDIDGVIYMGPNWTGVFPGPSDVIITGRSIEEKPETDEMLKSRGIENTVFYNPLSYEDKTRESSGKHKSVMLNLLIESGVEIGIHFEDDPIQADIIRTNIPSVNVVLLEHDLVDKENHRQGDLI